MNAHSRDWDDLRLVLSIVDGRGLSGASKLMGVHHATVLRRLDTLEKRLGVRLFDRLATGYRATELGQELANAASTISPKIEDLFRKTEGRDLSLSGTIRCATSDYLAASLLPNLITSLQATYPDIELEITVSAQLASLSKRDADVAIRATNSPPQNLVGTHIRDLEFGLFGRRDLVAGESGSSKLEDIHAPWITSDDSVAHSSVHTWRENHFSDARPKIRFDSLLGIFHAVKANAGIALLPVFLAESDPDLIRLDDGSKRMSLGLWILVHPDLSSLKRVEAFTRTAAQVL